MDKAKNAELASKTNTYTKRFKSPTNWKNNRKIRKITSYPERGNSFSHSLLYPSSSHDNVGWVPWTDRKGLGAQEHGGGGGEGGGF